MTGTPPRVTLKPKPSPKLTPLTTMRVPPTVGPDSGLIALIVGAWYANTYATLFFCPATEMNIGLLAPCPGGSVQENWKLLCPKMLTGQLVPLTVTVADCPKLIPYDHQVVDTIPADWNLTCNRIMAPPAVAPLLGVTVLMTGAS